MDVFLVLGQHGQVIWASSQACSAPPSIDLGLLTVSPRVQAYEVSGRGLTHLC